MSQYEFFSPEKIIQKYFSKFAGNIQNKTHSKALEYRQKVEQLREHISYFFGVKESHLISFQFNQYYIEKLIFKYLQLDNSWKVYSSAPELFSKTDEIKTVESLNLNSLSDISISKGKVLIWIEGLKNINLELFEAIEKIKKIIEESCYIFLSLDYLLHDAPQIKNFIQKVSFFSFNPSFLFQEYGTVIFAFKKELQIRPIFDGSVGAKLNLNNSELKINTLPQSLEIGTQNLISLIILERFFYFLKTEFHQIQKRLISNNLNFNLKKNLKPK